MNNVLQRRKGKIKMVKDLKYGKNNLRQSLIQIGEFEDLNKIYKSRKQFYGVEDQQVFINNEETEENQEQIPILMSPEERIEMYRKQKINKKLKERLKKFYEQEEIIKPKMRQPKISKMLDNFQEKYKNEMPISYKDQLRQSQINLQQIKKNNKRKFVFNTIDARSKRNSISRDSYKKQNSVEYHTIYRSSSPRSKKRFLSLKTSLPQKEKEKLIYPSIKQILLGKFQDEDKKKETFDIKKIQSLCQNFMTMSLKKNRSKIDRDRTQERARGLSPTKKKPLTANAGSRSQRSSVDKTFTKSQLSSKFMIEAMSQFYEAKHQKKTQYDEMVDNLKYDRPLTSNIRRRNYKVIGRGSIQTVKKSRIYSQKQRVALRKKQHQFYINLIEGLESYHLDDIPTTIYIIEEIKYILEDQYEFTIDFFQEITKAIKDMPADQCTNTILDKIALYLNCNLSIEQG